MLVTIQEEVSLVETTQAMILKVPAFVRLLANHSRLNFVCCLERRKARQGSAPGRSAYLF